jgi:hypothetical protein
MAVFITATTSAFEELEANRGRRPPQINVRRPLRGIQIKENTYATLRVRRANGEDLPVFDSSSPNVDENGIGRSAEYSNFVVASLQEQRVEKQQIIQTFGEDYIFFFGEQPRFINVSGVLWNTKDFNWKNEFLENYERYLRGTRLVENNARLYLSIDDIVVEGYLVSSVVNANAMNPYHVEFQFTMFVCQYAHTSNIGSAYFQREDLDAYESRNALSGFSGGGLPPESPETQAQSAGIAAQIGSTGGLGGFMAAASRYATDASLPIQRILESIRGGLVVPQTGGEQVLLRQLENRAEFAYVPSLRPIHENWDEYPERSPPFKTPEYDQTEVKRIQEELRMRTPEELERVVRATLAKAGIDTTRREPTYLLLGKGAFAAAQYMGTFGVRQADGELNTASIAANLVNF